MRFTREQKIAAAGPIVAKLLDRIRAAFGPNAIEELKKRITSVPGQAPGQAPIKPPIPASISPAPPENADSPSGQNDNLENPSGKTALSGGSASLESAPEVPPELFAAMLQAALEGDTHTVDELAEMGRDPEEIDEFMADTEGHTAGMIGAQAFAAILKTFSAFSGAQPKLFSWFADPTPRSKTRATNSDTGAHAYGERARSLLAYQRREDKGEPHPKTPKQMLIEHKESMEGKRGEARAAFRNAVDNPLSIKRESLPGLAEHLHSLTRDEIRGELRKLEKSTGGKLKHQLVDALLEHVKTRAIDEQEKRLNPLGFDLDEELKNRQVEDLKGTPLPARKQERDPEKQQLWENEHGFNKRAEERTQLDKASTGTVDKGSIAHHPGRYPDEFLREGAPPETPATPVDQEFLEAEQAKTNAKERKKAEESLTSKNIFHEHERNLPKDIRHGHDTPESLMAAAKEVKPVFDQVLDSGKGVDKALGGTAVHAGSKEEYQEALNRPGPVVIIGGLKGLKRATEKVEADYNGDWSKLHDVVRGTVGVDTHADIPKALDAIRNELATKGWSIAKQPKNKFETPTDAGYRDINLTFTTGDGLTGEIQVNTKSMLKAKEVGHHLYESQRKIDADAKKEDRDRTPTENAEYTKLAEQQKGIYDAAWQVSLGLADDTHLSSVLRHAQHPGSETGGQQTAGENAPGREVGKDGGPGAVLHGSPSNSEAGVRPVGEGIHGEVVPPEVLADYPEQANAAKEENPAADPAKPADAGRKEAAHGDVAGRKAEISEPATKYEPFHPASGEFYHVTRNGVGDLIRQNGFKVGEKAGELGHGVYLAADKERFPTHLRKSGGQEFETETVPTEVHRSVNFFPFDSEAPNAATHIYKNLYGDEWEKKYRDDNNAGRIFHTPGSGEGTYKWPFLHQQLKQAGYGGIRRTSREGDVGNTDMVVFDKNHVRAKSNSSALPDPGSPVETAPEPPVGSGRTADFAKAVYEAAASEDRGPSSSGGTVFLHHVYDKMKAKDPSLTREQFDKQMIEANKQGLVKMGRADLPQALHPDDVSKSRLAHGNSEFHFLHTGDDKRRQVRGPNRAKPADEWHSPKTYDEEQAEKSILSLLPSIDNAPVKTTPVEPQPAAPKQEKKMDALNGVWENYNAATKANSHLHWSEKDPANKRHYDAMQNEVSGIVAESINDPSVFAAIAASTAHPHLKEQVGMALKKMEAAAAKNPEELEKVERSIVAMGMKPVSTYRWDNYVDPSDIAADPAKVAARAARDAEAARKAAEVDKWMHFSQDAEGHEHKGKGPGGGQFVSKGEDEFAPKSGGDTATKEKPRATRGEMAIATRSGKGKEAKVILADGTVAPSHIKPSMIPPQWTDVKVSMDPDADLRVTGRDSKGRAKAVYRDEFHMATAANKFARVQEGLAKAAEMYKQNQANRSNDKFKDSADAVWLMQEQATRPGSDADTGGKVKAYGATTLEGRHIVQAKDGVRLQFIGKEGVAHDHLIRNPDLAKMLVSRAKDAGDDGKLFPGTNYAKVTDYTKKQLDGGKFTPKDFRTMRATNLALEAVKETPAPKNDKEYKAAVKSVAEKVSGVLGNRPQQALESYIAPEVFSSWRAGLG